MRSSSNGCSGFATGVPISAASYDDIWPWLSRGDAFHVERHDKLVVRDLAVLDHDPVGQGAHGASLMPTPLASAGHVAGSQREPSNIRVSPFLMLVSSWA